MSPQGSVSVANGIPRAKDAAEECAACMKHWRSTSSSASGAAITGARASPGAGSTGGPNGRVEYLDPHEIAFGQDGISGSEFRDGRSVDATIAGLRDGSLSAEDIPKIAVYKTSCGNYVSHDNRRLFCFKMAGLSEVPVIVTRERLPAWKYTRVDGGCRLHVRGKGNFFSQVRKTGQNAPAGDFFLPARKAEHSSKSCGRRGYGGNAGLGPSPYGARE